MDEITRRGAIKLVATAGVVATVRTTVSAEEKKPDPKDVVDLGKLVKNLKLKPNVTTLGKKGEEVADKNAPETIREKAYSIVLINRSSYTVVAFKAGNAAWFNVTPIPRTCNLGNCKACYDAGAGVPLTAVPCTEKPFDLYVMVRDPGGKMFQAGPCVEPSCDFNGEAVCLDI